MSTVAAIGVGPLEIGIVLLIVLIIFGPKRIPELGRSLGSGMRGFKEAVTGKDKGDDEPDQLDSSTRVEATADGRAGTAEGSATTGERATAPPPGDSRT